MAAANPRCLWQLHACFGEVGMIDCIQLWLPISPTCMPMFCRPDHGLSYLESCKR